MVGRWVVIVAAVVTLPPPAVAQTSVYSVLGLGYPGRAIGVRTRAMGGGLAALDPGSALNPGAVAAYRQLSASATSTSSFRDYEVDDISATGLLDTRFAYASLGGPFGATPFAFGLTFGTYLDRTYDVVDAGDVIISGDTVPYNEQISSDGAVIDLRGAVAWQALSTLRIGAAIHILSGTTENEFFRDFADSALAPLRREDRVSFNGVGGSVGVMWDAKPYLRLGASARFNGSMRVKLTEDVEFGRTDLPREFSGGVFFAPVPDLRVASTVIWRSWSRSRSGLAASTTLNAFDTFEVGNGLEILGITGFPLRLGFRWAQLPYSPTAEQPREINLSFGTGIGLASGRTTIEFALERVMRDGGGAKERAWLVSFELRVTP